jgi:ABC-type dipeptide/oligopeptide/nickel transport system permease subunit
VNKTGKTALALILVVAFLSFSASFMPWPSPESINLDRIKEPPSLDHPLGTDTKGRDILSRILYGGRVSISIAVSAAFLSTIIGLIFGLCSGYFGGKVDMLLTAFVDLILSFPTLLLAIAISVLFPPGIYTVVIAIVAVGWASFARIIRGQVLSLKEANYIEAAKAMGCSTWRIIAVHLMPQCIPVVLVVMGMKIGGYILIEASLSFLGLGAQPPMPTWGSMISAHRAYIASAPWMVFAPGFMIALTALCFNVLGDSLRDRFGLKIR